MTRRADIVKPAAITNCYNAVNGQYDMHDTHAGTARRADFPNDLNGLPVFPQKASEGPVVWNGEMYIPTTPA